ncbi:MAG: hypothetical protein ACUVWN_10245 [bacterium]
MRRGRTQVLFRYLPECVVDYTDTHTIGKVVRWRTRELTNINRERLLQEVGVRTRRFKGKRTYPPDSATSSYVFLEPTSVEIELFPLTFSCRKCSRVVRYRDIEELRRTARKRGYKCPQNECGGILDQIDLVHYHTCGKIDGLAVGRCGTHGQQNIILDRHGSDSPRNWKWKCMICGLEVGGIRLYCKDCREDMKTAPFRKSEVFYPHSITIINVPGLRKTDDERRLLLGRYLGILEEGDDEDWINEAKSSSKSREVEKKIEELKKEGFTDDMLAVIRKKFGGASSGIRSHVMERIDELVSVEGDALLASASGIQEFLETRSLEHILSLEDIYANAVQSGNPSAPVVALYKDKLKTIGIQNAWVIGDLPILSAVFGYSRGSADPSECILRSFPYDEQHPGKTPIYTIFTQTEAVLMEMDRRAVLEWIKANSIASNIPVGGDDAVQKAWFLNNVHPDAIPIYDEIPDQCYTTKMVYRLIHSVSHALLIHAAGLIGLDKNSLAEIILPNIPAFVLYSNNINDFQLGGMFTLMENSVIPWVEMTVQDVEHCLYDPVCIETEASCHACLQASEITCVHFNRDLGRDVLIGRGKLKGFWDHLYS